MTERARERGLDLVYAAKDPQELARAYAAWSAEYDRETIALGYCLPFLITSWVARYVPARDAALIDIGCGTGLSGPMLAALGYGNVAGMDLSADMLELARAREAYRELKEGELGKPLPFADDSFDMAIAAGVFTAGHAPASGFDEIARITKPGGFIAATVRDILIEKAGFSSTFERLEAAGTWEKVEESPPYRAFVLDEPETFVKTFVFRCR